MKYVVHYEVRGQHKKSTVEAESAYDAVAKVSQKVHGFFNRLMTSAKFKVLKVYSDEYVPTCLMLGFEYTTKGGEKVTMKGVSNAGTEYETMYDQHGVHRYSRSSGRIIGRCTACKISDPRNIVIETYFSKGE